MAAAGSAFGSACKGCPWAEVDRASAVAADAAVDVAAADGHAVDAGVEAVDSLHTAGMDYCSYLLRSNDARSCTRCPVW